MSFRCISGRNDRVHVANEIFTPRTYTSLRYPDYGNSFHPGCYRLGDAKVTQKVLTFLASHEKQNGMDSIFRDANEDGESFRARNFVEKRSKPRVADDCD